MVWYQSGLLIDICIGEAQRLDFKNCQGFVPVRAGYVAHRTIFEF